MIYHHEFKGTKYRTTVTGLPNPRWALESFSLEHDVREEWWDPQQGEVVIDAGAAYGSYTLSALAKGATVLACEPDKEMLYALSQNVNLNHFTGCLILPCVLCDLVGVIMGFDPVSHSSVPAVAGAMEHRLAWSVDSLCNAYRAHRLDWLKVDVEGAEVLVLKGAEQSLKRFRPKVLVENHPRYVPNVLGDVAVIMEPLGYVAEHRTGDGDNENWTFWRPT